MTAMQKTPADGPPMLPGELIQGPIVVGADESDTAQHAFTTALDIALRHGNELIAVSAYRPLHHGEIRVARREVPRDVAWRLGPDAAIQTLHEDLREQAAAVGLTIECIARQGAPAKVIVDVATAKQAGLVIVGNAGIHGRRRLCGSVPDEVSRRAPCSVLIVDTARALAA
jgi:nucleotide-binding universal stress UspA family protein